MRARSAFLSALGALATVAAPTAAAAVPAPTPGVSARQVGDVVTFTFDAAALAAAHVKQGDRLSVTCESVPSSSSTLLAAADEDPSFGSGTAKLGAAGSLVVELGTPGGKRDRSPGAVDVCRIERFVDEQATTVDIAQVALTQQGTGRLEDDAAAAALKAALLRAQTPGGAYRPAAAVPGVVPLASADASPAAPGQVGYWTDGTTAIAVTITPSLRRVFVADDGHLTARFNLSGQAAALFYSVLDDVVDRLSSGIVNGDPEEDDGRPPYDPSSDPQTRADGLHLSHAGRRVTVRFAGRSAKAYKKIAHRKVRLSCVVPAPERVFTPNLTVATLPRSATAVVRVSRHGGAVTATLSRAPGSVCEIWDDGAQVAVAGLDTTGRRWLQDAQALELISTADDDRLRPVAPGGRAYRPATQIAAQDPKRYVALSGPAATSPAGRVGVWSDGAQRYELVATSASGRRFFLEDQAGGVLRSNVLSALVAQQVTFFAGLLGQSSSH